jgi:adenylyl cyclase-associated protein
MLIAYRTRLEAATSRLEDIAVHQQSTKSAGGPAAVTNGAGAAGTAAAGAASTAAIEDSPAVEAWDEAVAPKVKSFADLSQTIGGTVADQVSGKIFSHPTTLC